jgi:glycogen operon protein
VKTLVGQRLMLGKELGIEGVSLNELLQQADIHVHGVRLYEPDLKPRLAQPRLHGAEQAPRGDVSRDVQCLLGAADFELPNPGPAVGTCWRRWIDTYRDSPDDVCDTPPASPVESASYTVQARSLAVLFALGRDETLGAARTVESRRVGGSP